jgi:hypothetical protein
MCHADQQWTIRTAYKADLQASVAELVYGEPLRIPGELLSPAADPVDPTHFITQLRQHMTHLRPVPAALHASPAIFVHKDLHDSTHVFLRQDTIRRALEPPYSGPYQVLSRRDKTLQLLVRSKSVIVSADRVKLAYVLHEPVHDRTPFPSPATSTQTPTTTRTTRSGRQVHFPARFNP